MRVGSTEREDGKAPEESVCVRARGEERRGGVCVASSIFFC